MDLGEKPRVDNVCSMQCILPLPKGLISVNVYGQCEMERKSCGNPSRFMWKQVPVFHFTGERETRMLAGTAVSAVPTMSV